MQQAISRVEAATRLTISREEAAMQQAISSESVLASLEEARMQYGTQYALAALSANAALRTERIRASAAIRNAQNAARMQLTDSREEREHEAAMAEAGYGFVRELAEENEGS